MTIVCYSIMIFFIILLFASHELMRWLAPWGAYFGGIGFTYEVEGEETPLDSTHSLPLFAAFVEA